MAEVKFEPKSLHEVLALTITFMSEIHFFNNYYVLCILNTGDTALKIGGDKVP